MLRNLVNWEGSQPIWLVALSTIAAGNLLASHVFDPASSWATNHAWAVMMAPIAAWLGCAFWLKRAR